mmetsp:Transcript_15639/g.26066  ORF Transcript_15639/g.26066 Transcript_15639/m.26066 type:complete len:281 (-) Transcript_15639:801-1643(-)
MKPEPPFDSGVHLLCSPSNQSERQSAIDLLRVKLVENDAEYDTKYCTDHQLMLFLQARNYDVDLSFQMMLETFEWRNFRHPHTLHEEEGWFDFLENETKTGKIFNPGYDRWGRPLMVFNNQVQNTSCADSHMRLLSWYLEYSIRQMPPNIDKYCVFMHMEGFSLFNAPSFAETRETIQMLCTCYPERLGHIIAYQPPGYFSILLSTVKMFLDARTLSKLVFINGDVSPGSENDTTLNTIIGDNWRELTGVGSVSEPNISPGYKHEEYWSSLMEKVKLESR